MGKALELYDRCGRARPSGMAAARLGGITVGRLPDLLLVPESTSPSLLLPDASGIHIAQLLPPPTTPAC
jgi:hypothetical protein